MQRVPVRLDRRNDDRPVLVCQLRGLLDNDSATRDGARKDLACVCDGKGDVLDAVSVKRKVPRDIVAKDCRARGVKRRAEREEDAALPDDVRHDLTRARLEAAVGDSFEAKPRGKPRRRLLCVSNPPVAVIKARELAIVRLWALFRVARLQVEVHYRSTSLEGGESLLRLPTGSQSIRRPSRRCCTSRDAPFQIHGSRRGAAHVLQE